MLLTFEIFGRAENHGKNFPKLSSIAESSTEHSENKIIIQSELFQYEIGLEYSNPSFNKHERWKNTKSTNHFELITQSGGNRKKKVIDSGYAYVTQ